MELLLTAMIGLILGAGPMILYHCVCMNDEIDSLICVSKHWREAYQKDREEISESYNLRWKIRELDITLVNIKKEKISKKVNNIITVAMDRITADTGSKRY